jgi:ATP/maltotriose-dependent transcriptional regulator MalT
MATTLLCFRLVTIGGAGLVAGRFEPDSRCDPDVRAAALTHLGIVELGLARLGEAERHLEQGCGLARLGADRAVGAALVTLGTVDVWQGRFEEAEHWLERAEHAARPDVEPATGLLHMARGRLHAARGQREVAAAAFRSAHGGLLKDLSESELRVLRYLPSNLWAPEIGREFYLSFHTVKTHMRNGYAKLGLDRRTEAVERARELGLLAPSSRFR